MFSLVYIRWIDAETVVDICCICHKELDRTERLNCSDMYHSNKKMITFFITSEKPETEVYGTLYYLGNFSVDFKFF